MKVRKFGFALAIAWAATATLPAQAALVISEVVFNEAGSDTTGEWIEIYNSGPATVDLTNYKIGDEETSGQTSLTEAMVQFPAGASIPVNGVQIVAVSATRFFTVYGFNPTYEVSATDAGVPDMLPYATWDSDGGVINMSNTNDQALILDGADAVVDGANWGNGTFFPNPGLGTTADGQSWERKNANVDTDTVDDWQLGPNPGGSVAADRSTPGTVTVPEPTSLAILVGLSVLGATLRRKS